MPRASKNNIIGKDQLKEMEKELYVALSSLDHDSLQNFMKDFLSDEEQVMLAKRLHLYVLLRLEMDISTIATSLSISRETVRTHKIKSMMHSPLFHDVISKSIKKKNRDKLISNIGNIITTTISTPYKMSKGRLSSEIYETNPEKK